jgi:protein TonB
MNLVSVRVAFFRATALFSVLMMAHVSGMAQAVPTDALRAAQQAVVVLTGEDAQGKPIAAGNGFLVRPGVIITDYRVIKDAIQLHAQIPGQPAVAAQVLSVDERRWVALVLAQGLTAAPPALACAPAKTGSRVFVVGGAGESKQAITAIRLVADGNAGPPSLPKPDVKLPATSSGSPVCDDKGSIAGIVVRSPENGLTVLRVAPAMVLNSLIPSAMACTPEELSAAWQSLPPVPIPDVVPGGIPAAGAVASGAIPKQGAALVGGALRRAAPIYPAVAKAAHVSGAVSVEITVDEEGDVVSARVTSGHPLLKDAALNAVRAWKFTPTMLEGKPVAVVGAVTFNFNL